MARVKRGVIAHARHKKVLEQAKGFYGRRKNTIRAAKAAVDKAGQYAYRDRKVRKRIVPLAVDPADQRRGPRSKASPTRDLSTALNWRAIEMDRKVLADIAGADPAAFKAIADKVRAALALSFRRRRRREKFDHEAREGHEGDPLSCPLRVLASFEVILPRAARAERFTSGRTR